MVQWKGEVTEEAGRKAVMLDSVDSLEVPNFFVLTPDETGRISGESASGGEVVNSDVPGEIAERIREAYGEIGMSSEVRGASDEARELVGGQRNKQRVSVRVSDSRKGIYESRLDVGSSSLLEAVKEVMASYYASGDRDDHPAVIIQKMVDPELSGGAYIDYQGDTNLVEAVPGLGISLEEGLTVPELYLSRTGEIKVRIPEEQVEVARNPMNGDYRRQTVSREGRSFSDAELRELFERLEQENLNVKFAYKRGSFYIVDASRPEPEDATDVQRNSLQGIRVSKGEISGEIGREISFGEQPLMPENYREALIARKGGYSSTAAQRSRNQGKPAIFSFKGELERGQEVSLGRHQVEIGDTEEETTLDGDLSPVTVTGSEILPLNSGNGVYTRPPFRGDYAVTDRAVECERIPKSGHLSSYREVFSFDGDRLVLDARFLSRDALEPAIQYLDGELKVLVVEDFDPSIIRKAIESGFTVFAAENRLEELAQTVRREERRFILDSLRDSQER